MLKLNDFYLDYLWAHNICVADNAEERCNTDEMVAVIELLAANYGIVVREGKTLADKYIYGYIESKLSGRNVPDAFYRGFPQSVRNLSKEELLIDQLLHYCNTYGMDNWDEAGHSIFEQEVIRVALKEKVDPKYIDVLNEKQAIEKLNEYFDGALASTRPLNNAQMDFVLKARVDFGFDVKNVASKNTAMTFLLLTRDLRFAKFISITDVPKFVEKILATYPSPNYNRYNYTCEKVNTKKISLTNLNLNSADRKFVTKVIQILLDKANKKSLAECLEKKKIWCGLLHHIHYKPRNIDEQYFVDSIRDNKTKSDLSEIESYINSNKPVEAAKAMKAAKGSSYILRNLNCLLSRCNKVKQVSEIINTIGTDANPIVMMQLALNYANDTTTDKVARNFAFSKANRVKHHRETTEEVNARKSFVAPVVRDWASDIILSLISEHYEGKLKGKKIYLSKEMHNIALPIYNSTGESGFGILPTGSRVPFDGKIIRAFTYWEKVNDIDLSVIGINEDATKAREFSWRNMYAKQSLEITFSGDETSGFNGGSEFFDVNLPLFKKANPDIRYLLFNNNVFSGTPFKDCYCTAGFMSRESADEGFVYEPKTVKTSYRITGESTHAHLFALDLKTSELVWLNLTDNNNSIIAGCTDSSWIVKYLNLAGTLNYYELFNSLAGELVEDSRDADVVVSDDAHIAVKDDAKIIHSYDIEEVTKYMNM